MSNILAFFLCLFFIWIFRMESKLIGYRDTIVKSDCHFDVHYILIFFLGKKWQDLCIWLNPWGLILTHKSNSNLKAYAAQTWPNMYGTWYFIIYSCKTMRRSVLKIVFICLFDHFLYTFICFIRNCKSWVTVNKFTPNLLTFVG